MSFSKQHFELVAATLKSVVIEAESLLSENELALHLEIAARLADAFATHNENFDRSRFLKACGTTRADWTTVRSLEFDSQQEQMTWKY